MRSIAVLALAACHGAPATPAASCRAPRPEGGFEPLGNAAVQFVASEQDEPLATQIFTAFAETYQGLELRRPDHVDRGKNLILFGRYDTNTLLRALGGPLALEANRFRFGGHLYDDPNDGIAVLLPSPFAHDRFVLAYAGNSPAGLLMTQSVPTGDHQFTVVGAPLGVQQEGDFCTDGTWHYHAGYAVDRRAEWETYRATLAHRDTAHHVIYYDHDSRAARDIDAIARELDADYEHITTALAVTALDHPIATYLWSDRDKKQHFTGDAGNGVAIGNTVHALYTADVSALGPHEYVHVIAGARIGESTPLWSEGLAVALGGNWNGTPLPDAVHALADRPTLAKLLCCFRDIDDHTSYPVAGHLVAYILERFGLAKFKQLYVAPDPVAAIPAILGVDVATLEAAWLRR